MLSLAAASDGVTSTRTRSMLSAVCVSIAFHVSAGALVVSLAMPDGVTGNRQTECATAAPSVPVTRVVLLLPASPGGGRGGGGGGNRQTGPIRRAEGRGQDALTLRIARPIEMPTQIVDAEPRLPGLLLDAKPLASGSMDQLGLPSGGVSYGTSTGPGSGGGVGTGTGTGIGAGRGPGLGDGVGGGTGGGVYHAGGSVTAPRLVTQVRPSYTASALERRIQGSVVLEVVVTATGEPSSIFVARSLDAGLDDEAIKAVREWRFAPGRMSGSPVNVLVTIILDFAIH
jgi:periplasmic protein TonB